MTDAAKIQQWHKGVKPERAATSCKQEDINKTVRQTLGLEVMKQGVKSSVTLQKMGDRT
jgi:hypothetical protein